MFCDVCCGCLTDHGVTFFCSKLPDELHQTSYSYLKNSHFNKFYQLLACIIDKQ